ncbi:MAG TPA: helix-turn-helix domain-containing protein [Cellvibrio sp.]|uniref:helix-turn-helix transcriptional regulator n=1 Tax=Cellvibrio sp. BR TaxID=1134474 RepID=UPI00058E92D2|nr:helix-turn-helix domain-containing protein [Cellvibrio sp. BR]
MLNDHLYLTVDELAHVSRLSRRTIYNKLSAGGVGLPPSIKFAGSRRVLFLVADVERWINQSPKKTSPTM